LNTLIISLVIVLGLMVLSHWINPHLRKINTRLDEKLHSQQIERIKLEREEAFIFAIGYVLEAMEDRPTISTQEIKGIAYLSADLSTKPPKNLIISRKRR
jgi:hypothetical protein